MTHFIFASLASLMVFHAGAQAASDLDWFKETYDDSRMAFLETSERLQKQFERVEIHRIKVASRKDRDLTIDATYVPAQEKPTGLVIVTSGVHGAEGFAGSALQRFIASEIVGAGKADTRTTGYLFIHAVNPYGFRYGRRVSEDNIDLNRNFGVDKRHFAKKNPGYWQLRNLLNPSGPASDTWLEHFKLIAQGLRAGMKQGKGAMTQAIGSGQYEVPEGIMFGGKDFAPQQNLLEPLLLKTSGPYKNVLVLDLHTGFGRRGHLHLLPNPPEDPTVLTKLKRVFGNYPIEVAGDGGNFYASEGDFSTYVSKLLTSKNKVALPMLIEFGTVDSQTYRGSLKTLTRLIRENQLHWHKAISTSAEEKIRRDFRELFFPSSLRWRKELIRGTRAHVPTFLANFTDLD